MLCTLSVRFALIALCASLLVTLGGCDRHIGSSEAPEKVIGITWSGVLSQARGSTVTMAMWQGDPAINAYMRDFVIPHMSHDYGVTLKLVPGQGHEVVATLLTESEAKRPNSALDVVWINGETFSQLRQINALYGPFTADLPNTRLINWENPFIAMDFQQAIEGYECPWGNVQLLMITDRRRVPELPRTPQALAAWIHAHPGRFTFDTSFTGMSLLKSLMYAWARSPDELNGPFNEDVYMRLRDDTFAWVKSVRADLWRNGKTFPTNTAQLHQLFANGELDFTMSFNDGEVDNKVNGGMFPETAMGYALAPGTIQNSHYLGIVNRSAHKAAAMVLINFLISPEAQLHKLDPTVWGDGTVLATDRLPANWRTRFELAEQRRHAPARSLIAPMALREPSPELMQRLTDDFRQSILHE